MQKHEFISNSKRLNAVCVHEESGYTCQLQASSPIHEPPASSFTAPQIAVIRRIVLETLDSKPWLLYEQIQYGVVLWKEWQADRERLDLCDEIQRRLIGEAK